MKYIVFGLGISGIGAKELLEKKGLEYIVVDDKQAISSEKAIKITNKEDVVIKSPGISWNNKYLDFCKKNSNKIISEIDLALQFMNKNTKIIAITGTNGKTTTVTKTYELLKYMGYNVALGGNEGHSFSKIIAEKNDYDYIVLELSSYQLENNPSIKPYIALVTNLTPDHLLRYNSVDDYYMTKMNIFKNQDEFDYCIINTDDKEFERIFEGSKSQKVYMNDYEYILDFESNLKGEHNKQNMLNIISIAKILNIPEKNIKEFLSTTNSLEHRMENFFSIDDTYFINDSKGTNVESTLYAIEAYKDKELYLICGGQDKKIDNTKLYNIILDYSVNVLLIGENANQYIEFFEKNKYNKYINLHTMENVVEYIKNEIDTKGEKYILLSPATASFDQYRSFEERGKHFKKLVLESFGE